jgi:hypothetical protein
MKRLPNITIYKRINIKAPDMLAGWPGMGNVALGMVDYLRRSLQAVPIAEVDTTEFSTPDAIIVEDGIASLPSLPKNIFYYQKELNLVIFESEAQLRDKAGMNLMMSILDFAQELQVQRIYTGAAFPMPISYKEASMVFGVGNDKSIRDYIYRHGIKIMEGGQISGLNGLLLGYAAEREIESACLLATIPQYAINFPNPKASKAIVEALCKILDFNVDMTEIDMAIKEMDMKMSMIEDKIKEILPIKEKESDIKPKSEKEKVPDYIMKKIEKLFEEAKQDKQKAYKLKEELDRWNLYNLYEDRFLDLFRKEDQ